MTATRQLFFGRRLARRTVNIICRCSVAFGSFDAEVIDGVGVNGVGRLASAASSILSWFEAWIVEGPVKFAAGVIGALSFPVRMIQNGSVQSYMLSIVFGLIAILGYALYLAHHAIR
jgi:hypothetical protein